MITSFSKRHLSTWLKQRLSHIHQNTNKTVGILVDKSEVDNLDFLGNIVKSKEFKQDLAMSKSYWLYHPETHKRVLLVQRSEVKADAKPAEVKEAVRQLGATMA